MRRLIIGIVILLLPVFGSAQETFFSFTIDQDHLGGAADFGFLNRSLGLADRLFAREGHFFRVGTDLTPFTNDDERVRMFGVNLAFGANFPKLTDGPRIARRLRRLGVNLVRLHHMDSQPDRDPNSANSILTTDAYPTLNPVAVERLRAFLDALKEEGIYCNLNLHVGYQFRPSLDGVPALPDNSSLPSQSKPLHIFFPRMVELQAEFTRRIIAALRLEDDPVLAMVEINNESSLLQAWQTGGMDRYLQSEYKSELQQQWNAFLNRKYGSTESLRSAWRDSEPDGLELLSGEWRLEIHRPAQASLEMLGEDVGAVARVQVAQGGAPVILKQVGFSVTTDRPVLAEVEVRADLPAATSRSVYWDIKQDISPWHTVTGRTISVTNEWQRFTMAVWPTFAMAGIGRFGLSVENVAGHTYVRNARLREAGLRGLAEMETLETATVSLVGENELATKERADDYLLFLADRDRAYLHEILGAIRQTAGRMVPVAGTQMGYGGLLNTDSHQKLDYDDNHFYVDHYNFPNIAWDGRDWRIRDTSSVGSGLSAFQNMAVARQFGRPYTVSEFNQPWPNTYAAEIDPTLAAFAVFQDWDSIMHFAYSHGPNWDDGVPNGFNLNGDWTKFPNVGQSAWLFRSGALQSGNEPIDIPVSRELQLRAAREKRNGNIVGFLSTATGFKSANVFIHPVAMVRDEERALTETVKSEPPSPYSSDTGEITYDPNRKLFLIHASMAAGVFGFAGREKASAGAIDVELSPAARGFCSILLTPLDHRRLADSAHLLLSVAGSTLRSQPGVAPSRPQRVVNYGTATDWWTLETEPGFSSKPSGNLNGGVQPVWMERVEAYVTLRTSAIRLTLYPLDGAGQRLLPLGDSDIERINGGYRIRLQGQAASPWYEIVAEH